jgi:hypothetical protein
MTGTFVSGSTDWFSGKGTYTNNAPPSVDYFWVGYVCQWTGNSPAGEGWKCGCRDQACAKPMWQLQEVKYPVQGGTTAGSASGGGTAYSPTGQWVPFPPGSSGNAATSVAVGTFVSASTLRQSYQTVSGTTLSAEAAQDIVGGPLSAIFPEEHYGRRLTVSNYSNTLKLLFTDLGGRGWAVDLTQSAPDTIGWQVWNILWPADFKGKSVIAEAFLHALVSTHFKLYRPGTQEMETDLTGYW